MPRYVALLRAINVGGHVVKMERLRGLFEAMGLSKVETFIASGNVIFETRSTDAAFLEEKIATELRRSLGYDVATFLRTDAELAAIAAYAPFPPARLRQAAALNIVFQAQPVDAAVETGLAALRTAIDDFQAHGREIYWLCRRKQSESTISNVVLEKSLGRPSTIRGADTIKKMAEKYPTRARR